MIEENIAGLYDDLRQELSDDPTVVAIQEPGKSEQLLAYRLKARRIRFQPFSNVVSEWGGSHRNRGVWVCIDDAIVSGASMLRYLFKDLPNGGSTTLQKLLSDGQIRIVILVSHADERGVANITSDPRCSGSVQVRSKNLIDDTHRVFSPESRILSDVPKERLREFKDFCEAVGNRINPGNPLGWNSAMWCIVFEYSVPNATLPLLFTSDRRRTWLPLFPRRR